MPVDDHLIGISLTRSETIIIYALAEIFFLLRYINKIDLRRRFDLRRRE